MRETQGRRTNAWPVIRSYIVSNYDIISIKEIKGLNILKAGQVKKCAHMVKNQVYFDIFLQYLMFFVYVWYVRLFGEKKKNKYLFKIIFYITALHKPASLPNRAAVCKKVRYLFA